MQMTPQPDRDTALARLADFLPHAGEDYERWRNHDFGPGGGNRVSGLSPWLRHRLIGEDEVVDAVLQHHGLAAAEKFIQEVCWRTYWKGFLERRPVHWREYRDHLATGRARFCRGRDSRAALEAATTGRTGIDCFDAWARELVETGYLHNHARMWFASIWVFTLELPWALGADFFLRHLLDGDPASNTLSWRWVAGLHTPGKSYLARPRNIRKYSNDRFTPGPELASEAPAPEGIERPPLGPVPAPVELTPGPGDALLITEEDLTPERLFPAMQWPLAVALQTTDWRSDEPVSDPVRGFANAALADALQRTHAEQRLGPVCEGDDGGDSPIVEACIHAGIRRLITPYVPNGPTADGLEPLRARLQAADIELVGVPRHWDLDHWPAATHGFFRFWKAARPLIEARQAAAAE